MGCTSSSAIVTKPRQQPASENFETSNS
jgi:hypothetical protein